MSPVRKNAELRVRRTFDCRRSGVLRWVRMDRRAHPMRTFSLLAALVATMALVAHSAVAAPSSLHDPLLDHLIGTWALRGKIAGKQVTHTVNVQCWTIDNVAKGQIQPFANVKLTRH
jgi:hypothetical protein